MRSSDLLHSNLFPQRAEKRYYYCTEQSSQKPSVSGANKARWPTLHTARVLITGVKQTRVEKKAVTEDMLT